VSAGGRHLYVGDRPSQRELRLEKPGVMPVETIVLLCVMFSKMLWLHGHSRRSLRVHYLLPKHQPLSARRWWKYHTSFSFNL
jgi:hypothetical protein